MVSTLPLHELLAAVALLDHEPRTFEHRDVLLHGGEAHRVAAGERGDVVLAVERAQEDVAPGGVGEGVEHPVGLVGRQLIYNHMVVCWHSARPTQGMRPSRRARQARRLGECEQGGAVFGEREAGLDRRVGVGRVALEVHGA